jgi:hypothetical protein
LPGIIRIIELRRLMWEEHVTRMEKKSNPDRLLVGKPEGGSPLGIPKCGWVNDIKVDLVEIGFGELDWIGLAQDRYRWRALVNSVMNLRVP